jgi:DNA-binding CsgD family transcriptional regulator
MTALAGYEYYKQVRKAHKEYEKAKDFIEDIVLSFDRELKRESDKFDTMISKVKGSYNTANLSYRKADNIESKIEPIEQQLGALSQSYQAMSQTISQNIGENTQNSTSILTGLTGLETKIKDIEVTQETLRNRILAFEDQIQNLSVSPPVEAKNEIVLPSILIKRDKAMSALTDTEITVLEMLSKEGAKTAPEIKERVKLSREHTARLMKKLYEEGYLEREAGKIPFRYSIKKEMEALLQKSESTTV